MIPKTLEEAKRQAAQTAMADLLGCSEPADGQPDEYPFNACTVLKVIPPAWRNEVDAVIAYVYHHEDLPEAMRKEKHGDTRGGR